MTLITHHRRLNRQKTLELLDSLSENKDIDSCTLYLPPQKNTGDIRHHLKDVDISPDDTPSLVDIISKSPTGAVVFGAAGSVHLLIPPFPVVEPHSVRECATARLEKMLQQEYTIGLVLVRLGAFAVGVCKGEKLLSSKVGTGNIHARHKKGGSSAHRFERHRDKQIEYFFTRVCQRAREHLEPQVKALDYMVYGGARSTIRELQKQCDFLGKVKAPLLPPVLDIPDPRLAVLKDAIHRVWSSTVYEWLETD
jgi:peptide subunit release factor 1 (eRF1)